MSKKHVKTVTENNQASFYSLWIEELLFTMARTLKRTSYSGGAQRCPEYHRSQYTTYLRFFPVCCKTGGPGPGPVLFLFGLKGKAHNVQKVQFPQAVVHVSSSYSCGPHLSSLSRCSRFFSWQLGTHTVMIIVMTCYVRRTNCSKIHHNRLPQ